MGYTLRDIANLSQVSIGTVDRVLHGRSGVNENTRLHVQKVCEELNYRPNPAGKSLALQRRENIIAVIAMCPNHSFSEEIIAGMNAAVASRQDLNVSLKFFFIDKPSHKNYHAQLDEIEKIKNLRGIIIKPADCDGLRERLNLLAERGVPIVTCTSDLSGMRRLSFVGENHREEGALAAAMLCAMLREPLKIGILTYSKDFLSRAERVSGFCEYIQQKSMHGFSICKAEIVRSESEEDGITDFLLQNDINALFVSLERFTPVSAAVKKLHCRDRMIIFSFGTRTEFRDIIRREEIDFFICETPFKHGYKSVLHIMDFLVSNGQTKIADELLRGEIVLAQNS